MASGGFDIAKAGWLYRQSSVLHRWKKNWFVLDRDGDLRYFESPHLPRAEERIVVRAEVVELRTGPACRTADPPEGVALSKSSFLELVLRGKESMLLCADSPDDMKAWQIALEEARTLPTYTAPPAVSSLTTTTTIVAPPGYIHYGSPYGYPGLIGQAPPTQVIHTPSGTTTVINTSPYQQVVYMDQRPYRHSRYSYGGLYPVPLFFW